MRTGLDDAGIIVALLAVALLALTLRRYLLRRRGATIDLSLRLRASRPGFGWAFGMARYDGDRMLWYRVFGFGMRPRRTLPRTGMRIVRERRPTGAEAVQLTAGSVVVECVTSVAGRVELAMPEAAVPGFRAWLESAPDRGPEIA